MKILITGASGFLGKNLIKYLPGQFEIEKLSARYIKNQVFNISSDAIVHLSGKAHDLKNTSQPSDYYEANFELTKQLYDGFLISDAKKFIFISSVKAVIDQTDAIVDEQMDPDPKTVYGKSKLMAEEYIMSKPLPAGKEYYILRPCMIHGPGNKGNLNLLYKIVKAGIPYPLAAFINKRSFLTVENLCFVIKELLTRNDIESGVYHVADDEPLPTNEVVKILSSSIGAKSKLWAISPGFIKLIAKIGDKLKLPLTSERLDKLTENYIVSNAKIKKALNKPLPISAKEGLKITAVSFNTK